MVIFSHAVRKLCFCFMKLSEVRVLPNLISLLVSLNTCLSVECWWICTYNGLVKLCPCKFLSGLWINGYWVKPQYVNCKKGTSLFSVQFNLLILLKHKNDIIINTKMANINSKKKKRKLQKVYKNLYGVVPSKGKKYIVINNSNKKIQNYAD